MTPAEMEAGRELDALIAERVMGWEWCRVRLRGSTRTVRVLLRPGDEYWGQDGTHDERDFARVTLPAYSTDIGAAWRLLDKVSDLDVEVYRIQNIEAVEGRARWVCRVGDLVEFSRAWSAEAPTAPLAICRAALLAVADRLPTSAVTEPDASPTPLLRAGSEVSRG